MNFKKFFVLYIIIFSFWLLLSGVLDSFHIISGLISTGIVTKFTYDMVYVSETGHHNVIKIIRFFIYLPWILYQIILANFDVAKKALSPTMPIDPDFVTFNSFLQGDLSKTVLANSITLTPGTVTVDIDGDEFLIHAISKEAGDDLLEGTMERNVAHIFLEDN